MTTTTKEVANAVAGKTARACDSCLKSRARWYCAADDAFLCQVCDSSVHSANQLASRHERVRLEIASNKPTRDSSLLTTSPPAWHHGFTRKARTRRTVRRTTGQPSKESEKAIHALPLVPEVGSEEGSVDENEQEQLLCRVPIFAPFVTEDINEDLNGFFESDMDLADFAADVESLLGSGLDDDTCGVELSGFLGCKEEENARLGVKVEDDDELEAVLSFNSDPGSDGARDLFEWNFDFEEEEEEGKMVIAPEKATAMLEEGKCKGDDEERRNIFLRLDYAAVISAWASQGSPWTTGTKPVFNSDVGPLGFMGKCYAGLNNQYGGGRVAGGGDEGREARVTRYREKRRTRLFSKKIRYEVRKLNAEKRPRMKGRFVRRTAPTPTTNFPNFPHQITINH